MYFVGHANRLGEVEELRFMDSYNSSYTIFSPVKERNGFTSMKYIHESRVYCISYFSFNYQIFLFF